MNKKFQILCLVIVGIFFQAKESKAITAGDLYKACKSYTDAGFKIRTVQQTLCIAYIRGLLDMQRMLCEAAELRDEKDVSYWFKAYGTASMQLNNLMQLFSLMLIT